LVTLSSGLGDPAAAGALHIHQDVALLAAYLDAGCPSFYHLAAGRGAYLVPTRGTIEVNGTPAAPRSGTAVSRVDALTIRTTDAAEIVLMDLAPAASDGSCRRPSPP
jgi:redox-sensitive bicupin YhaK (pirin superfamily)